MTMSLANRCPVGQTIYLGDLNHLPLKDDIPIRDLGIDRHDCIHSRLILERDAEKSIAYFYSMSFRGSSSTG